MFALRPHAFGWKNMPAIEDQTSPGGCVDLDWWIALTKCSPRLEEVAHADDRPSALFTRADGSKFEVRYQFGMIVPQEWQWCDPAPMLELAAYQNDATKEPIQSPEPMPPRRHGSS
jgi:hypothetical protein